MLKYFSLGVLNSPRCSVMLINFKLTNGWISFLGAVRVVKALINVVDHSRLGASDTTTDKRDEEEDTSVLLQCYCQLF